MVIKIYEFSTCKICECGGNKFDVFVQILVSTYKQVAYENNECLYFSCLVQVFCKRVVKCCVLIHILVRQRAKTSILFPRPNTFSETHTLDSNRPEKIPSHGCDVILDSPGTETRLCYQQVMTTLNII